MAIPSIPHEIHNAIIDFLSNDVTTLRSCALASSILRPRSQEHLFQTISIQREDSVPALDAVFLHSPHLSRHTQLLELRIPGSIPIWGSPGMTRILGALKHVEGICISFPDRLVYGRRAPDTVGPAAVAKASFTDLKTLSLEACAFQSRASHDSLLRSLPSLRSLSVGKGVRCWECLHYRNQHILPKSLSDANVQDSHLDELTFECASDNGRCILQSIKATQIKRLRILGAGASGVESNLLNHIIEAFKSVQDIHVNLRCPPTTVPSSEPVNTKRPRWTYATDTALADRLDAIVDSSHHTTLSKIVLILDDRACRGADWVDFGAALSSTTVKHLHLQMAPDVDLEDSQLVLERVREGLHGSSVGTHLCDGLSDRH